jgi:hypothetical protein
MSCNKTTKAGGKCKLPRQRCPHHGGNLHEDQIFMQNLPQYESPYTTDQLKTMAITAIKQNQLSIAESILGALVSKMSGYSIENHKDIHHIGKGITKQNKFSAIEFPYPIFNSAKNI